MLGTEATVRQPYVDRLSAEFAADCTVIRHGSAELVDLAEAKLRGEATDPAAYARILDGLFAQPGGERIDTIVLACTHFPLVEDELAAAAPRPVAFVDGKEGIARRTAWLTRDRAWPDRPARRDRPVHRPRHRRRGLSPRPRPLRPDRIETLRRARVIAVTRPPSIRSSLGG